MGNFNLNDNLTQKARDAGAQTTADVGVFLLGGAIGGLVDAAINAFGFADPLVVAGLTGSAALGLKNLV